MDSLGPLLSLLEDTDPKISRRAMDALKKTVPEWSPRVERGELALTPLQRDRLTPLIESWKRSAIEKDWHGLVHREQNGLDFQRGLELLSRINRPQLPEDFLDTRLLRLETEFRAHAGVPGNETPPSPLQLALRLSGFLGEAKGLRGNTADYYAWRNSFIEQVIDTGVGIPISLSSLYILLGGRAGLSLFGVGLPGHLVIGFHDGGKTCYLDPFQGGELISRHQCERIIRRYGQLPSQELFAPLSTEEYLARVISNMVKAFGLSGDADRVAAFQRCHQRLWSERLERRGSRTERAPL